MNKIPIKELLHWRQALAEADAPPAPRGRQLLGLAKPWWDAWPEQFRELAARLVKIQIAYGHAMTVPRKYPEGYPVPTLVTFEKKEAETSARVLYLNIRDGWLRLRFQLKITMPATSKDLEVTFVNDKALPLLSAAAVLCADHEYRIDAELPDELAEAWTELKVTERMPFRFIVRPDNNNEKEGG